MEPDSESALSALEAVAPKASPLLHRLNRGFHISAALHLVGARDLYRHHMMVVRDARAVGPLLQVCDRQLEFPRAVMFEVHCRLMIRTISRFAATSFSQICSIST